MGKYSKIFGWLATVFFGIGFAKYLQGTHYWLFFLIGLALISVGIIKPIFRNLINKTLANKK